jgi:hypothetical protein
MGCKDQTDMVFSQWKLTNTTDTETSEKLGTLGTAMVKIVDVNGNFFVGTETEALEVAKALIAAVKEDSNSEEFIDGTTHLADGLNNGLFQVKDIKLQYKVNGDYPKDRIHWLAYGGNPYISFTEVEWTWVPATTSYTKTPRKYRLDLFE